MEKIHHSRELTKDISMLKGVNTHEAEDKRKIVVKKEKEKNVVISVFLPSFLNLLKQIHM